MSYRSIKRVLGETSLERKCRFLFGVCLFALIASSFWLYSFQTDQIINDQNRTTGRLLVDQEMAITHWKKLETKSEYGTGFAQGLSKSFSKQRYKVRFILPNLPVSHNAENDSYAPTTEELSILKEFQANKPSAPSKPGADKFKDGKSEDGDTYYYYQPIYASEGCLTACHMSLNNMTGGAVPGDPILGRSVAEGPGDLMAVAQLTFSTERTNTAVVVNRCILMGLAIITFFLAMVAAYVIVRYVIVKPLRHLRDVSDAISRGNSDLRADIHTGDEFEELAVAFNRMLRHLTDVQDEIRLVNANLDGKVDELAQANMRLYELNMLKSDFLATMSHELRTPLNSILGFSEVLGSIDALDDKQKRYVQNIQKSGRTLLEMINDILDLAKIENGKMEIRLSDFRIANLVTAQCDMARPLTERKNIDLEIHVNPDLPPMHQDQARVQQILNNLLSNAIKFTPEGGRISIAAKRDDAGFLQVDVTDTGVGIAKEEQQAIFEKFRQGKTAMPTGDTMTREYSGSGLGLSIVKELCKLLGGEILLESELGRGSTFTVRLPWQLEEQPHLDSAIVEGYEEFSKQRFDVNRESGAA
jgi:signal transduction histidine kinase